MGSPFQIRLGLDPPNDAHKMPLKSLDDRHD